MTHFQSKCLNLLIMQIDVELTGNNYTFETVIDSNNQERIEVNFNASKRTINVEVDMNYSVINNTIIQNIINNHYSLLTFLPTDIC